MYNRCNQCDGFFSALHDVFANDPSLRRPSTLCERFGSNMRAVREFIIETHAIPPDEKVQWIKTVLQNEQSHPTVHSSAKEQQITEILADIDERGGHKWLQEHFHCHSIARYKPSMPHSDSARYRPSSHVPPARSNPLRFVKYAR